MFAITSLIETGLAHASKRLKEAMAIKDEELEYKQWLANLEAGTEGPVEPSDVGEALQRGQMPQPKRETPPSWLWQYRVDVYLWSLQVRSIHEDLCLAEVRAGLQQIQELKDKAQAQTQRSAQRGRANNFEFWPSTPQSRTPSFF